VIGGELIVHVNENGIIHRINGMYLSPTDISIEPTITGDTAVEAGLAELEGTHELRVTKEPSLVIYDSRLAWHFVISHEEPDLGRWWYYVDAHSGEVILGVLPVC
jgi:Zn-dependent metalloprotease